MRNDHEENGSEKGFRMMLLTMIGITLGFFVGFVVGMDAAEKQLTARPHPVPRMFDGSAHP